MLIWHSIETGCPICNYRIKLRELGSGFATGQDSDLLIRMKGRHIIQAAIHTCLRCKYSGYPEDFNVTLRRSVAERFLAELSPTLRGSETPVPLPDLQYYWSYLCAQFRSLPELELGLRLLRASWCLRLPPSRDLPPPEIQKRQKLYLTGAIHHLRGDDRWNGPPVILYLLAELSRRNGEFPMAVGYFKRFLDRSVREPTAVPKYLRLAAMKLLRNAEQGHGQNRTMEEIVYADSPE